MSNKIGDFLEKFSSMITEENKQLYNKIIETSTLHEEVSDDYEKFYYGVVYPFEKFVDGMIRSELRDNQDVVFLMSKSKFVKRHFTNIIERIEGSACSVDKSRTIIRGLIRYYMKGEEIKFDYDGEYTYHLPKVIFKEQCRIIEFYEAVKSLYYGNSEKYMKIICMLHADVTNQLIM